MNPQTKKILTAVLIIIVGIALALLIWWQFFREEPAVNNVTVTPPTNNVNVVVVNAVANTAPANQNTNAEVNEELELIRLANLFTERIGSFSSESEFQNIIDLKSYMTKTMQAWADNYIKVQQAQPKTGGFSSIVTKAISTKVQSLTSVNAQVQVTTQRQEEGANINGSQTYYQDISLEFTKSDDDWLVDKATWQPRS